MLLNENLPHAEGGRIGQLERITDVALVQVSPPGNVTVTVQGSQGSTTCTYVVAALSVYGASPSAAVSVTTANATLNAANFNVITWNPVVSGINQALAYAVYRTAGGPSQGLIATIPGPNALTTPSLIVNDTGLSATAFSGNAPAANTTGCVVLSAPVFSTNLVIDGPLPATLSATTGQTITAAQMLTPLLVRSGATSAGFSDTTPSAAALISALTGVQAGGSYVWIYRNTTGNTATLLGGAGVTLAAGNTNTTATVNSHTWMVVFTNVTAGSEAVTMYSLGSAQVH